LPFSGPPDKQHPFPKFQLEIGRDYTIFQLIFLTNKKIELLLKYTNKHNVDCARKPTIYPDIFLGEVITGGL
jgi:hypothetical protein